jgi:signal transduction histidine kinase
VAQGKQVAQAMSQALLDALRHDDVWLAYSVMRRAAGPSGPRQPVFVLVDSAGLIFASSQPARYETARKLRTVEPELDRTFESAQTAGNTGARVYPDTPAGLLTIHMPLVADTEKTGALLVSFDQDAYRSRFWEIVRQGAYFTLGVAVVTMLVGLYLGDRLVRPLINLANCMGRVGHEPLEDIQCALPSGTDEIGRLTASFFRMVQDLRDKEELERAMVSSERLVAVGRLAAGVAHEINNPLAGMLVAIDTLKTHGSPDEQTRRTVELLERGLKQIRETVGALLLESRRESHPLAHQDFEDVRMLVESQVCDHSFRLRWENRIDKPVNLPSTLVRQVLLNLMLNAVQASHESGAIRCTMSLSGNALLMKVWNDGDPITPEVREQLFEPYVTSRQGGGGLGLWVSHQIVTQLHGSIEVRSGQDGTEFRVTIPVLEHYDERVQPEARSTTS